MMRTKFKILIPSIFLLLTLPAVSFSLDEFPKSDFEVEKYDSNELVVEYIFSYWSQIYRQPLIINEITRTEAKYDTPEQAFIAFQSAMQTLDFNWFVELWDTESLPKIQSLLTDPQKAKITKKYWAGLFENTTLRLLRRIDRKERNYVIFEFQREKLNEEPQKGTANFRKCGASWKATNQFSSDPVSNYLGDKRVKLHGE